MTQSRVIIVNEESIELLVLFLLLKFYSRQLV